VAELFEVSGAPSATPSSGSARFWKRTDTSSPAPHRVTPTRQTSSTPSQDRSPRDRNRQVVSVRLHKTANCLDALPKSAQPAAKRAIQDIYNAEDKEHAVKAVAAFAKQYGAKYPKVVKRITDDEDELLAFFDYPAEHWIHLRTTNPIESTFATVRLRTKVTKGAGSRAAALAMVFKLIESAQARWRAVNAPHLVALVRAGARFERGLLVERSEAHAA
jgi:hypothetical protein